MKVAGVLSSLFPHNFYLRGELIPLKWGIPPISVGNIAHLSGGISNKGLKSLQFLTNRIALHIGRKADQYGYPDG